MPIGTSSAIVLAELHAWAGVRCLHPAFSDWVLGLRANVRAWDAYYVALAEALDAPLATLDRRLADSQTRRLAGRRSQVAGSRWQGRPVGSSCSTHEWMR